MICGNPIHLPETAIPISTSALQMSRNAIHLQTTFVGKRRGGGQVTKRSDKRGDKRLAEQRERQQVYRKRIKSERRPSRDDIARVLLHVVITRSAAKDKLDELEKFGDLIVDRLVEQGFDKRVSYDAFDQLVDKYVKQGWEFRRKTHITNEPPTDSNDPG
jgi:hypothetical protein